jgi:anti-anti-sigma regulatory factor
VRRHDGKLVLVNIPKKIRELLNVTRLLDILEGKTA